jgi:hypothetical protein
LPERIALCLKTQAKILESMALVGLLKPYLSGTQHVTPVSLDAELITDPVFDRSG